MGASEQLLYFDGIFDFKIYFYLCVCVWVCIYVCVHAHVCGLYVAHVGGGLHVTCGLRLQILSLDRQGLWI